MPQPAVPAFIRFQLGTVLVFGDIGGRTGGFLGIEGQLVGTGQGGSFFGHIPTIAQITS